MSTYPGVGDRIGRFRVLAQLGAGGMGVVYEALEENLGRRVALKVIAPVFAEDDDFRERFGHEARALASLDSPHVVQVYAHGEEDGYLYIATQLIPDGDLGQMVGRWGPAPFGRGVALIEDVAAGLADAHDAGLVHRDIKAANVLVRRRGSGASASVSAYLGDFGIARRVDAEATRAGSAVAGTPSSMAPELHQGAPASPASDLYSLGCLLWVTLTGTPPYAGTTELAVISAHLEAPVPQLAGASPLVDAVNHVLRRSMAKNPDERYRQAGELRDDLRRTAALTSDPFFHAQARPAVGPLPPQPPSRAAQARTTPPAAPYAAGPHAAGPYAAASPTFSLPGRPSIHAPGGPAGGRTGASHGPSHGPLAGARGGSGCGGRWRGRRRRPEQRFR